MHQLACCQVKDEISVCEFDKGWVLSAGCSYLLTPGSRLAFGKLPNTFCEFVNSSSCCTKVLEQQSLHRPKVKKHNAVEHVRVVTELTASPALSRLLHCNHAGDQSQLYTVNFEETDGPDPLGDMLVKVGRS